MHMLSFVLWLSVSLTAVVQAAEPPRLSVSDSLATAGYYRLDWATNALPAAGTHVLEEATAPDFSAAREIYRGPDRASLLSGRRDGIYHYRVRMIDPQGAPGPWSVPVRVEVRHHPLARAGGFFLLGLLVFVALVYAVLRGDPERRRA